MTMKKTYKIEVDCANCANKMEEATKKTAGVKDATVNFMTLKMIRFWALSLLCQISRWELAQSFIILMR